MSSVLVPSGGLSFAPRRVSRRARPALVFVNTVTIPAMERFVVQEKFVVGENRIVRVGENVMAWFWAKIESESPETVLRYHRVIKVAQDNVLRRELGGGMEECSLASIHYLLSRQAEKKRGPLLMKNRQNAFYARDASGELRVVRLYWAEILGGWTVHAGIVTNLFRYERRRDVGYRLFSPAPLPLAA